MNFLTMITVSLFYCCEIFKETSLVKYHRVNMEDITDADYALAKGACKDFEIKTLGEYHDLYVQCDTLLLANVFENFRNMCLETFELYPAISVLDPAICS